MESTWLTPKVVNPSCLITILYRLHFFHLLDYRLFPCFDGKTEKVERKVVFNSLNFQYINVTTPSLRVFVRWNLVISGFLIRKSFEHWMDALKRSIPTSLLILNLKVVRRDRRKTESIPNGPFHLSSSHIANYKSKIVCVSSPSPSILPLSPLSLSLFFFLFFLSSPSDVGRNLLCKKEKD